MVLISETSDLKGTGDRSKRRFVLHFSIDFYLGSTSSSARQR